MGETETKAQAKERVVTLGPNDVVVCRYHWAGFAEILRMVADYIDRDIGEKPKPSKEGKNSAETEA